MSRILIFDDDRSQLEVLNSFLGSQGFEVITAGGIEGFLVSNGTAPDLILVKMDLPDVGGFSACRWLREQTDIPIIALSAGGPENEIVRAFNEGANDYLAQPVRKLELVERINARIRDHNDHHGRDVYLDKSILVDLIHKRVIRRGKIVHLTPVEYKLLCCLVSHAGEVVSHQQILQEVWGHCYLDGVTNLSLYIHYLREKLEDDPDNPVYIRNEWGSGYWFSARKDEIHGKAETPEDSQNQTS